VVLAGPRRITADANCRSAEMVALSAIDSIKRQNP
jgi:hypothetical protein